MTTKAGEQVLQRVRQRCLALPETSEVSSWGHPSFKAGRRAFVTFEWIEGRPSIAFRLDPMDVQLLLRRKECFETPYGRGQWVSAWTDRPLDWVLVARLIEQSYRTVALKRMLVKLDDAVG